MGVDIDLWEKRFKRNERVTWRVLEGDCILLHLDTGYYYTLNEIGSFFWESLDGGKTLSDIHEEILDRYEVDGETARKDLGDLLSDFVKENLVQSDG